MLIHKTEYVENAHNVGRKAYFLGRNEGLYNMDLENIFLSKIEEDARISFSHKFNVTFNTGYIYWNSREYLESIENERISELFHNDDRCVPGPDYDVSHLFEIRLMYPTEDQLKSYYHLHNCEDVELLMTIFEGILNKVVKRCGPGYREAFLKGATELAYALSHRKAVRQKVID